MKTNQKNHQMMTSGTKAELAARVRSANPTGEWMTEVYDSRGDRMRNEEEGHSRNEDSMVRKQEERDQSRVMQGMHLHREPMDVHNKIILRELELVRRETGLMERELNMTRQEMEMELRNFQPRQWQVAIQAVDRT